jgi:hypothetical protein
MALLSRLRSRRPLRSVAGRLEAHLLGLEAVSMTKSFGEKPPEWADWGNHKIHDAGSDIFYAIIEAEGGIQLGGKASNVWVWHWHTPTALPARWQLSACGLHDVVQVEPLTLSPSLACEDGCPSHGYIENGTWRSV